MEESVASSIEKIKLQEQDKEAKLIEKREFDATIASLHKAIRDATTETEKSEQEQQKLIKSTDLLRRQELLEQTRQDALSSQLNVLNKELKDLRAKSNHGISEIWERRSSFCKEMYSNSDAYDVWALLMKPTSVEPILQNIQKKPTNCARSTVAENANRLEVAIQRRIKAIAERDRLLAEPDNGKEFVRLRNALRYSLQKISELIK